MGCIYHVVWWIWLGWLSHMEGQNAHIYIQAHGWYLGERKSCLGYWDQAAQSVPQVCLKQHGQFQMSHGDPIIWRRLSNGLCLQKFPLQKLGETICLSTWLTTWLRKWQVSRLSLIEGLAFKSPCGPANCAACRIQLLHRRVLRVDIVHLEVHQRNQRPCCRANIFVCHRPSPMLCLPNLLARLDLSLFAWIFVSLCPWSWFAWAKVASVGLLLCVCWHSSDSPWAMAWKVLLQPVAKDGNSLLASSKQSGALFRVGVLHLGCASNTSSSLQGAGTLHDQPWALVSQTHWNIQVVALLAYAPSNQHGSCSWPRRRQVRWDRMQGLAFWRPEPVPILFVCCGCVQRASLWQSRSHCPTQVVSAASFVGSPPFEWWFFLDEGKWQCPSRGERRPNHNCSARPLRRLWI